ncbi:hypothetical protein ACTXOW_02015 [Corynebacterium variabile]
MALAFSSGVYFEGMGLLLCNPVPSIKPGAIHTGDLTSIQAHTPGEEEAHVADELAARRAAHTSA